MAFCIFANHFILEAKFGRQRKYKIYVCMYMYKMVYIKGRFTKNMQKLLFFHFFFCCIFSI